MVPLFEGPFFCHLNELSSCMTNVWLKAIFHPEINFYQMKNGMNEIANLLLASIVDKIDLMLSTDVKSVSFNYTDDVVSSAKLTFQNNVSNEILTEEFDYVVCIY